ncbi:hypothetical protein [Streptomyces sp. NPDC054863]
MSAAATWLTAAADDPSDVYAKWAAGEQVWLPTGRVWDVIAVTGSGPAILDALPEDCRGPVIADLPAQRYFFFVPLGTARWWTDPRTVQLGWTSDVSVPDPDQEPDRIERWIIPPDGSGNLTDPQALREAISQVAAQDPDHPIGQMRKDAQW